MNESTFSSAHPARWRVSQRTLAVLSLGIALLSPLAVRATTIIRGHALPDCEKVTCRAFKRAEHEELKKFVRAVWSKVSLPGRYALWKNSIGEVMKKKRARYDVGAQVSRDAYVEAHGGPVPYSDVNLHAVYEKGNPDSSEVSLNVTFNWRGEGEQCEERVRMDGGRLDICRWHFGTGRDDTQASLTWTADEQWRDGKLLGPKSINVYVSGTELLVRKHIERLRKLSPHELFARGQ